MEQRRDSVGLLAKDWLGRESIKSGSEFWGDSRQLFSPADLKRFARNLIVLRTWHRLSWYSFKKQMTGLQEIALNFGVSRQELNRVATGETIPYSYNPQPDDAA